MYDQCGGEKSMLKFYYKNPTLPLEWGIRPIKEDCPDICMVDLQNCHRDFDVPVNIYVEEDEVEPLVAIDSQGNPIEKEQEEEIRHLLDGIDFEELDGDGNEIEGDRRKDCEGQGVGGLSLRVIGERIGVELGADDNLPNNDWEFVAENDMTENVTENLTENVQVQQKESNNMTENVTENFTEIPVQQNDSNMTENLTENFTEIPVQNMPDKDPSKKELIMKLKRVLKDKKNRNIPETRETESGDHGWASEAENEDDLVSLEGSEGSDCEKHPVYKESSSMKNLKLVAGMKFENAAQFRVVLRDWCIRNGVDLEFLRNEAARVTAKCKVKGCEWRIHASPVLGGPTFQIKTIKGEHTCARTYDNRLANASYIAKRIEKAIRDHPTIPVQQLKNRILSKCNVDVSRFKVMRAKREALERIRGDDAKQYELLWDYCETVRSCNPGSKLLLRKVENSDPPVFDRMYVYGGQLLVAVGRDGNDNMFPIAMAVVQVENRDSWGWFVGELLDDIGGLGTSKWSFISDRQKGLVEALKDLVPDSEHRFCVRHMYENFKMKWKSVELKEYFWKAASTANKREFENFMKKIEELDPKIKPDVEKPLNGSKRSVQNIGQDHIFLFIANANEAVHAEIPQVAARKRRQPAASRSATQVAAGGRIPNPEAAQPPTESSATQQQIARPQKCILIGEESSNIFNTYN
ncbi:UNVERIFIED_CONTAM: hypothetical protein Sradi_0468900 [Sesamum radiatum]|uniref:Transposase MuDR plant domain-containing protein n=1 Tax=Sesamum radiatum TaxID=300843 RepID=A0AAW2WBV5_SESRA